MHKLSIACKYENMVNLLSSFAKARMLKNAIDVKNKRSKRKKEEKEKGQRREMANDTKGRKEKSHFPTV